MNTETTMPKLMGNPMRIARIRIPMTYGIAKFFTRVVKKIPEAQIIASFLVEDENMLEIRFYSPDFKPVNHEGLIPLVDFEKYGIVL